MRLTGEKPFIVIPVGIPGSGKTTLREDYEERYPGICVISPDDIRMSMLDFNRTGIAFDPEIEHEVWKRAFDVLAGCALAGKNIFFDATNLTSRTRHRVLERVDRKKYDVLAVYFEIDPVVAITRVRSRKRRVPVSSIKQMHDVLEKPTIYEGFDEIMVIRVEECGR